MRKINEKEKKYNTIKLKEKAKGEENKKRDTVSW